MTAYLGQAYYEELFSSVRIIIKYTFNSILENHCYRNQVFLLSHRADRNTLK